tara:strand:- start:1101 stop:1694 length:594 start_codon:yes stop_codon:yes gene_type:complete
MLEHIEFIINTWLNGGWVMMPLFILSVMIYYYGSEMFLFLDNFKSPNNDSKDLDLWIEDPLKAPRELRNIITYSLDNVTTKKQLTNRFKEVEQTILDGVEKKIILLSTLVAAAPLMGLLGTVIGMLSTFSGISMGAGEETISAISSGISEALITTQTGLFIALPGTFLIMFLQRKKAAIETFILTLESKSLTTLTFN